MNPATTESMMPFVPGQTLRFQHAAYGAPAGTLVRVTRAWGDGTMYPGGYTVERLDGGKLDAMIFGEVRAWHDTVVGEPCAADLLKAV